MKKTLLVLSYFFALSQINGYAGESIINTEDRPGGKIYMHSPTSAAAQKTTLRHLQKDERHLERMEVQLKKLFTAPARSNPHSSIDFKDSVNKWFWLWILGWGAGILITLLSGGAITAGAIGIFWFGSFIFGSIGLIVWLVKKFG